MKEKRKQKLQEIANQIFKLEMQLKTNEQTSNQVEETIENAIDKNHLSLKELLYVDMLVQEKINKEKEKGEN